ncbi:MAG: HEAT repeat domain-containing protein, partial [Planctomycetota bacterium]|nr:HEAT repeat domain-containing protein [Planctomycetota bacterium]
LHEHSRYPPGSDGLYDAVAAAVKAAAPGDPARVVSSFAHRNEWARNVAERATHGRDEFTGILLAALGSGDARVRLHATRALAHAAARQEVVRKALAKTMGDADPTVRVAAAAAYVTLKGDPAVAGAALIAVLATTSDDDVANTVDRQLQTMPAHAVLPLARVRGALARAKNGIAKHALRQAIARAEGRSR